MKTIIIENFTIPMSPLEGHLSLIGKSCNHRSSMLKIKKKYYENNWSEAEIIKLQELINKGFTPKQIATEINTKQSYIYAKCFQLKLNPENRLIYDTTGKILSVKCKGCNKNATFVDIVDEDG